MMHIKSTIRASQPCLVPWLLLSWSRDRSSSRSMLGVKPHEIRCGMPMEVAFETVSDQMTLAKFRPRTSS